MTPFTFLRCNLNEPPLNNPPISHAYFSDLIDGTPVLDIKPYVPYVDALSLENTKTPGIFSLFLFNLPFSYSIYHFLAFIFNLIFSI